MTSPRGMVAMLDEAHAHAEATSKLMEIRLPLLADDGGEEDKKIRASMLSW